MKYQKYLDSLSTERKYCLLDRMRIDCEYFWDSAHGMKNICGLKA